MNVSFSEGRPCSGQLALPTQKKQKKGDWIESECSAIRLCLDFFSQLNLKFDSKASAKRLVCDILTGTYDEGEILFASEDRKIKVVEQGKIKIYHGKNRICKIKQKKDELTFAMLHHVYKCKIIKDHKEGSVLSHLQGNTPCSGEEKCSQIFEEKMVQLLEKK